MKNLIGLIAVVTILLSCSNPADQRKIEIDQQLVKLRTEFTQIQNEKNEIKKDFEKAVTRYRSLPPIDPGSPENEARQTAFEKEIKSLELRLNQTQKKQLLTRLKMERLKMESAKL